MSCKNPTGDRAEIVDEDDDVLLLKRRSVYQGDIEERENSEEENNCQSEKMRVAYLIAIVKI